MHRTAQASIITCDSCGKTFGDINGDSVFKDDDAALDAATLGGWWCDGYGHHYCKKDTSRAKREAKAAGIRINTPPSPPDNGGYRRGR